MGFLNLCNELAERGRLGNDSAMMEYTNKLALSAFSFADSEGRMLCSAVLLGGKARNSLRFTMTPADYQIHYILAMNFFSLPPSELYTQTPIFRSSQ